VESVPCTLIIPAAGDSMRFKQKTDLPKALVKFVWKGRYATMIDHVIPEDWEGRVVVGVKTSDVAAFAARMDRPASLVGLPPTSGQAETVVRIISHLNQYDSGLYGDIVVLNCDNAFDSPVLDDFLFRCRARGAVLGALTFRPSVNKERYGYVDAHPVFTRGAEKDPISAHALAGAFYFRDSKVIMKTYLEETWPGEVLYLSQLFEHVKEGRKVSVDVEQMFLHEWGTPETLCDDPTVKVDFTLQDEVTW